MCGQVDENKGTELRAEYWRCRVALRGSPFLRNQLNHNTMKVLTYNAGALRYEVPAPHDLRKERLCLIEDMSKIQIALGKGPVDEQQFEQLMKQPMDALRNYVFDQHAVLNRHHYDQRTKTSS